jgi:uncharacterized protein
VHGVASSPAIDETRSLHRWRSAPWPRPGERVNWGVGAAIAAFFGAQLLAGLWASLVVSLRYGSGTLPAIELRPLWLLPVLAVGLWAGYLGGPVLVNRLTDSGPLVDFDLHVSPRQAVGAALAGIGAQLIALPALYWLILRVVDGDPGASAEALVDRVDGGLDVALLVLAVVVMAPLAEEWFYRGMLFSAVSRRFGVPAGAVGSSLVFAAVHQELILLPGLFLFALVLAALTASTGRIGVAIVAHMAFNATTVVQLLT